MRVLNCSSPAAAHAEATLPIWDTAGFTQHTKVRD